MHTHALHFSRLDATPRPFWRARRRVAFIADDANSVVVPGHMLLDARVAFDEPFAFGRGRGVRGFVSVNNLTGRRYIGSAFLNPDVVNGAAVAFEPGRPREVVIGLTVGAL